MKRLVATTALALAVFGLASQASATLVTVTYQGVVSATQLEPNGYYEPTFDYDTADLFGGGNLEGADLTAVVQYNPALGSLSSDDSEDDGGAGFFTTSPITDITLSINGYSYSFTPDQYGTVQTYSGSGIEQSGSSTAEADFFAEFDTPDAPSDIFTSFTSDVLMPENGVVGGGYLTTDQIDSLSNSIPSDTIPFDTYSVSVSAVPEPSSWALMIAGVGFVGFALRRRTGLKSAAVLTV